MLSAVRFNLDQSKNFSSGYGLNLTPVIMNTAKKQESPGY